MHANSLRLMADAVAKYVPSDRCQRILDIGAMDVNGTYAPLFAGNSHWHYTGADIAPGPNVALVIDDAGEWECIESDSVDVLISGQTIEHCERPWNLARSMFRVVKPGGLVIVIAPWRWCEHRWPLDCWRILPDGMRVLFCKTAHFEEVECGIDESDCIFAGRKV